MCDVTGKHERGNLLLRHIETCVKSASCDGNMSGICRCTRVREKETKIRILNRRGDATADETKTELLKAESLFPPWKVTCAGCILPLRSILLPSSRARGRRLHGRDSPAAIDRFSQGLLMCPLQFLLNKPASKHPAGPFSAASVRVHAPHQHLKESDRFRVRPSRRPVTLV